MLPFLIVNYYIKCIVKDKYAVVPSLAVKWIPRENKKHDILAKNIAIKLFIDGEPLHKKMKKYRQFIKDVMDKIVIIEKTIIVSFMLLKFLYVS